VNNGVDRAETIWGIRKTRTKTNEQYKSLCAKRGRNGKTPNPFTRTINNTDQGVEDGSNKTTTPISESLKKTDTKHHLNRKISREKARMGKKKVNSRGHQKNRGNSTEIANTSRWGDRKFRGGGKKA